MAGHSKWANIKFRKAAQDAKRGKKFSKMIKEITVASRDGGSDPDANAKLRTAIDKALAANMSRDTIDRAVKRGAGQLDGVNYESIRYEGYAPGGIAVLVETSTDNRNRTVSEVRHAFTKHGGNLGTDGSVSYLFNTVGSIVFSDECDEDAIMEVALEAGAEDIETEDGVAVVTTLPEEMHRIEQAFRDSDLVPDLAEVIQRPTTETELAGVDAERVIKLINELEELDDVQDVFTNAVFISRIE